MGVGDALRGSEVLARLEPDRQHEMARVTALLYASGGLLVLVSALIARWPDADMAVLVTIALSAIAAGPLVLVISARTRLRIADFASLAVAGSVIVAGAVVAAGPVPAALYGIFFVYVAAYSTYYYPRWLATAEIVFASVAYGVALVLVGAPEPVATWIVVTGASTVGGGIVGVLGRDERDVLRRERDAADRLLELESMKDLFLQSISHDLRTPLTAVAGFADILHRRGAELDVDLHQRVTSGLIDASDRLESLILELLEIQGLMTGGSSIAVSALDLDELVRERVEKADASGRPVEFDLAPVRIHGDRDRLGRLVDALVDNALIHTPSDGAITITVGQDDDAAFIRVEDEGPGIPPSVRERLAQPFTHGPTAAKAAAPGAGIGLALAAGITELHGGELTVDDRPSGGARIEVRLPALRDPSTVRV